MPSRNPTGGKKELREAFYKRLYEGTGRVLYQDDFEDLFKWRIEYYGFTGISTKYAYRGSACAYVYPRAAVEEYAGTLQVLPIPENLPCKIGLECWFALPSANASLVNFEFGWKDGEKYHFAGVTYDVVNDIWCHNKGDDLRANFVPISGTNQDLFLSADARALYWHHVKLIADLETDKLVSLLCEDKKWDLSNLSIWTATSTEYYFWVTLGCRAITTAQPIFYFDDLIMTEEE